MQSSWACLYHNLPNKSRPNFKLEAPSRLFSRTHSAVWSPHHSSPALPTPPKAKGPKRPNAQTQKRGEQSKLHLQQGAGGELSCFSSPQAPRLPHQIPHTQHQIRDQGAPAVSIARGSCDAIWAERDERGVEKAGQGKEGAASAGARRMRPTMKAQHGNGRGSRSPFLTSYALTLAFITFVSVLYFKDFSSTLHRPFLHRPPPHPHPHRRPRHHGSSDSEAGRRATAAEQLPFAVGAAPAGCDVGQGEWVYDEAARPWYQEEECPYIQPQLTCQAHGRPDRAYQHWRWQPRGCSLPSFNATLMLEILRGKRMLFVGDSLNRGQYVSLVCLLHRIIPESSKSMETFDSLTVFKAKDYNATIEFYWAPFLAESNSDDAVVHRIADRIVRGTSIEKHAKFWKGADILVFNTYLWWMTGQKMKILQNSFEDKNKDIIEMETEDAYGMVLNAVLKWVESNMNPKTSRVFFVTMSPTHTRSKDWGDDTDGNCYNQTTPIKDLSYWGPGTSKGLMRVIGEVFGSSKIPVGVVNITQLSEYRKDAHTQIYKKQWNPLTPEQIANPKSYADCTHWCLPGLQDTWNELLYSKLFFP